MTDETLGSPQQVIHADAEADLLNDSVGVLGIDTVLYSEVTGRAEVFWRNLHQVGNLSL